MTVEEIKQEAEKLSLGDRGALAADLLSTLGRSDYDVSDEEVTLRIKESESGDVEEITMDDLKRGLKNLPSE